MTLSQALLIALLGYIGSIYGTWFLGTVGGWNLIGRPIVAGAIIGLILGDVTQGIITGAAVQALYVGLVTPGLSVPGDVNFASYIGIPLALVAGAKPGYAVALSVPLSFLGVALIYFVVSVNVFFVHLQEKWIQEGKFRRAANIPILACVTQFVVRFFPIFFACYYGGEFVQEIVAIMPQTLGNIFLVLGGILPAIGFGLLMKYTLKQKKELLFLLVGFIMISVLKMPIIPVTVIALFIAVLDAQYNPVNREAA